MHWGLRVLIVLVSLAAMFLGAPLLAPQWAYALYIIGLAAIALTLAPVLAHFSADALVDLIFAAGWTTAETSADDPNLYNQSQKVFSLLRTISFLTLAAALYGIFWSVPILLAWPPIDDASELPRHLIHALIVGILSAVVWLFYLFICFIPALCRTISNVWWGWYYGDTEVEPAPDSPPTEPTDEAYPPESNPEGPEQTESHQQ